MKFVMDKTKTVWNQKYEKNITHSNETFDYKIWKHDITVKFLVS